MSDADKECAQGLGDQIKGRVEQGLGGLTGNREQQAHGGADEAKGKLEQGLGDLRDKASEAIKGA